MSEADFSSGVFPTHRLILRDWDLAVEVGGEWLPIVSIRGLQGAPAAGDGADDPPRLPRDILCRERGKGRNEHSWKGKKS